MAIFTVMLSVLIPIYRQDPSGLLDDLLRQSGTEPVEIIVCDDGSPNWEQDVLRQKYATVRWLVNPKNIGRSKTRNRLLKAATKPYVVFIDGDCRIPEMDQDFLLRYANACQESAILCGGHRYHDVRPHRDKQLHYTYGRQRESVALSQRESAPLRYFFSSNFCAPRLLLTEMGFNEDGSSGYGYEDSLLGAQWIAQGGILQHLDNPVIHEGLTTNKVFLDKADQAVLRLSEAAHAGQLGHIKLLSVYRRLTAYPMMKWLLDRGAKHTPKIRQKLLRRGGPMWRYDLYRLLRLHRLLAIDDTQ